MTEMDIPVGMWTNTGAVYTEIEIRRKDVMNNAIKAGEIFKLSELVPYRAMEVRICAMCS